jgi:hypothetical protein
MTGPRPAGHPWTQLDDKRLSDMLVSGMRRPEIAAKLKRTAGAVHSRVHTLRKKRSSRPSPTII